MCEVTSVDKTRISENDECTQVENEESVIIKQFSRVIDTIFHIFDEKNNNEDSTGLASTSNVLKKSLKNALYEGAKLKSLGLMKLVPKEKLARLLQLMIQFIKDGKGISVQFENDLNGKDNCEDIETRIQSWITSVLIASEAALSSLYIMTSSNMPIDVFLDDVINEILLFTQYHLKTNVLLSFNATYNQEIQENFAVKKEKGLKDCSRNRKKLKLQIVYDKLQEIISLLSELVCIKKLTDKDVFLLSDIGLAPFFVNNINKLQLSALKLITSVFEKNEMHRRLILEDIIESMNKLPQIQPSFNNYKLFSTGQVQMLTALVLSLVQSTVTLPEEMPILNATNVKGKKRKAASKEIGEKESKKDYLCKWDTIISCKYKDAIKVAGYFLNRLLNKCVEDKYEGNCRSILDIFVLDVVAILNKPEWPVSELLLHLLGRLLIKHIRDKNAENSLRILALEYLGNIAIAIKKEMIMVQSNVSTIIDLAKKLKVHYKINPEESSKKQKLDTHELNLGEEDEKIIRICQEFLLSYLKRQGESDQSFLYARHFHIAQWFEDVDNFKSEKKIEQKREGSNLKHKHRKGLEKISNKSKETKQSQIVGYSQKHFLISQIKSTEASSCDITTKGESSFYVDYETTKHITRYLAMRRPFYKSFDVYLQQILLSIAEPNSSIRTKAMKCLTAIVEKDPSTLARADVHVAVCSSFLDHSILVRGNAVDLVGKYVLSHLEILGKYYDMLSQRILDTGMSVRKRVIKILKDIYIAYPAFDKNEEICIKIIHRFVDEYSIQKFVTGVFQEMWFNTSRTIESANSSQSSYISQNLQHNVTSIIKVVALLQENDRVLLEKILYSIFKPYEIKSDGTKITHEPSKSLRTNFKDTVNCLVDYTLKITEETAGSGDGQHSSQQHLVTCLCTLQTFAKICPEFFVSHVHTLQPYLSIKCETNGDLIIIKCVVQILEVVIPLMEHPSELFLSSLEEDMVKLVFRHEPAVVQSCLSCLSTVNKMTKNYKLIRDIFEKFYFGLLKCKKSIERELENLSLENLRPYVRRCVFTLGILLQYFNFLNTEEFEGNTVQSVFSLLIYFLNKQDEDLQKYCLIATGAICTKHYEFMLNMKLITEYQKILSLSDSPIALVIQVLNNFLLYFKGEETRINISGLSESHSDLKVMGNNSCDTASKVVQLYQHNMLELLIHKNFSVRHSAILVFQTILQQGLTEPMQIIPYLISSATDKNSSIKNISEKLLNDIEKRFPRLVFTKCQLGLELSFIFQKRIQNEGDNVNGNSSSMVQGYRRNENGTLESLNSYVYRLYQNSTKSRRALVKLFLKPFEREIQVSFPELLYLAHNLAYFPYESQDEVLFIIHNIDLMVPLNGRNIIDNFKNALLPQDSSIQDNKENSDVVEEIINEDPLLITRIPEDTAILQRCILAANGYILLVDLKKYLENLYNVKKEKLSLYSPGNSRKATEKNIMKPNKMYEFTTRLISDEQNNLLQENPELLNSEDLIKKYLEFSKIILDFDDD